MKPYELSLASASAAIASKELSPVELTTSCLERIHESDGLINAFVTVTAEAALLQARHLEDEIQEGHSRGPLHGIPFAAKDIFDTAGITTTASSRRWATNVPSEDSAAVARLLKVGMPLLGKTHTHEFAYGATTPQSRNPRDLARLPGGSSGGSAAAIGAGMCTAALGSDTGGSIRIPASVCGVVGLKPTYGLVSRYGVSSLSWSLDHVGPLGRNVEDTALLLEALAGYDVRDRASVNRPVESYSRALGQGLSGVRVGVPTNYFTDRLQHDVATAAGLAANALTDAGAKVTPVELPLVELYHSTEYTILRAEASAYHAHVLRHQPEVYGQQMRMELEAGMAILAVDYIAALRARTRIQDAWKQLFQDVDVILAPTVPGVAVLANDPYFKWIDGTEEHAGAAYVRFSLPANITGLPSLSVPFGRTGDLPIGMQIIGRPFEEAEILRCGHWLEEAGKLPLPASS